MKGLILSMKYILIKKTIWIQCHSKKNCGRECSGWHFSEEWKVKSGNRTVYGLEFGEV